jgi:hypothetical protein
MTATADTGALTDGIAAAYRIAALIALAGALTALVALRRTDVTPGAQHFHAPH